MPWWVVFLRQYTLVLRRIKHTALGSSCLLVSACTLPSPSFQPPFFFFFGEWDAFITKKQNNYKNLQLNCWNTWCYSIAPYKQHSYRLHQQYPLIQYPNYNKALNSHYSFWISLFPRPLFSLPIQWFEVFSPLLLANSHALCHSSASIYWNGHFFFLSNQIFIVQTSACCSNVLSLVEPLDICQRNSKCIQLVGFALSLWDSLILLTVWKKSNRYKI